MKLKAFILTIVLDCILMGCGIKGDPLPPAQQETVQKQAPSAEPAAKINESSETKKTKK